MNNIPTVLDLIQEMMVNVDALSKLTDVGRLYGEMAKVLEKDLEVKKKERQELQEKLNILEDCTACNEYQHKGVANYCPLHTI